MSGRQPGKGYQGGGGGGGGEKGGGGGGGRGRGGQGHYQGGGGGGQRGGYGGGRDSKLSVIKWGKEKLKCEEVPGKVACGWKHDMELPTTDNEIKALMPKLQPGKLKESDVKIETNHFEMKLSPPKDLFRYEVDIKKERGPREEAPSSSKEVKKGKPKAGGGGSGDGDGQPQRELKVNRDIMKKIMIFLVNKLKTDWEGKNKGMKIAIIHDFSRILISTKSLDPSVPLNYELKHSDLPGEDGENCVYKIKLTHAQFNVDMERLTELIRNRDYNNPEMVEWKQIYNILMKNLGDQTYVTVGRSNLMKISPPTNTNQLGWGMMNWSGVSAICTLGATWKPFLNIEIQNCAFLIGQPVLETIAQIFADWKGNPNMQKARDVTQWKPIDHENVASILISCKVRRFVNRTPQDKKVTGIHRLPPSKVMFQFMNKNMSVADYFATYRGGPLQYPNGPVLMLGPKTFVPAECLTIREGQSINRILSGQPQKTMLKLCTQDPIVKHRNIHQKMKDMNVLKNPMLAEFGVSLPNANMLELNTRVLKAPELQYGLKSGEESGGRGRVIPTDGTWEMWDHPVQFYRPALIEAWAVVTVGVSSSHVNFVQMMRDKGRARGLMFPEPNCVTAVTIGWQDLHDDAVGRLTKTFSQIKSSFGAKQRCFILCVIPKKPSFQYNQVKQAAEREGNAGVLTQCLQVGNCEMPKPAVVNNVLLKINAKLGGINHVPIINHSLLSKINILQFPTLILGMDVNHPSVAIRGSPTGNPSYASVTGSLDRTGMPYMMHVQAQLRDGGTRAIGAAEVIANLDTIVKEMMMKFREVAGCQPGRIIVFRDGVGESQFPEVLQTEMMAIRKACTSLHKTYKPPITFVAVQKRHKVRFFRKEGSSVPMGRSGNVPPGTVVDTEIVQNSDFYLLSHSGLLGTSRPTHYHVLWDDSDFSMDDIQGLAYHLCYAYSRCNRSVSYPAPTYYAHWAASRAKGLADGNRDWEGDQRSLDRLNARIKRDAGFQKNFPMHFI